MKRNAILCVAFLSIYCHAALFNGDLTHDFFKVPNAMTSSLELKWQTWKRSDLDETMITLLQRYPWNTKDHELPETFAGYKTDLNGDKIDECFIVGPFGGSGGHQYIITTKNNGVWTEMGSFQGWFYVMEDKAEWKLIISFSRGGAGTYSKSYLMYEKSKYVTKKIDRYESGKVVKGNIEPALDMSSTKVPTEKDAVSQVYIHLVKAKDDGLSATQSVKVIAKFKLGFEVPGFAQKSNRIWLAHLVGIDGVTVERVAWINAETGLVMFPLEKKKRTPNKALKWTR
jgi:hypothetical protein